MRRQTLRVITATALAWQGAAHAATHIESGDAGQILPSVASVTITSPTQISGTIDDANDADLFAIRLAAGTPFTAQSGSCLLYTSPSPRD